MENTTTLDILPVEKTNKLLSASFSWMGIGLLISAVTSFIVLSSETILRFVFETPFVFYGLLIGELVVVWYLSSRIRGFSIEKARIVFILYAILSGTTLSVIFFVYQLLSIFSIFIATAIMFWLLALYGKRTNKDLTKAGRIAIFGLIGLIIVSIINIFIINSWLDMIVSWIGVIIFTVLIAYDVQKLKRLGESEASFGITPQNMAILGALTLYLDFINLFLSLLRIFGKRK